MCETNKNSNHRISGSSIITYDIKKFSNRSEDVEMKCLSGIDNQIPAFGTWRRTLAFSGGGSDFSYKQDCNDSILRLGSNPGFVHSDSTLRGCNVALGSRCLKDSLEKNEMPTHHHYDPVFAGIMQRRRRREQRPRRQRTTFSTEQTLKLELEYAQTEYISRPRRFELAEVLSLTENQIKIWFQNRRAKEKRIEKAQIDQQLRNAGLGTQVIPCDFSNRYLMYGTYPWSYSSDTILTGHKDINLNSLKAQGGVFTDDEESDDAGEEEEGDDGGRIFCIIDDNKCDDYKFDESS